MIVISKTTSRGVSEQCRCCRSDIDTMRITFSMDGTDGTSIVLCDKCRRELAKKLERKCTVQERRKVVMTNVKKLQEVLADAGGMALKPEQEMVVLLTSIASSLAVIADAMENIVDDKE